MTAPLRNHGRTAEQWAAMCLDKVRYADEPVARAAAMTVLTKPRLTDDPPPSKLYVYQCPNCRGWHMTRRSRHNGAAVTPTDIYEARA